MRVSKSAIVAILCLLGCAHAGEPVFPPYDHTHPVVLNEYAIREALRGNTDTALILLERAVRLSPDNAAIRRNLDTLRAWKAGESPSLPSFTSPSTSANEATATNSDSSTKQSIPALWPKR